jgi:hypothetical protein
MTRLYIMHTDPKHSRIRLSGRTTHFSSGELLIWHHHHHHHRDTADETRGRRDGTEKGDPGAIRVWSNRQRLPGIHNKYTKVVVISFFFLDQLLLLAGSAFCRMYSPAPYL